MTTPVALPVIESRAPKSPRNLPLEGLRGALALSVVVFHLYEMGANAGWYPEPLPNGVLALSGVYIVCIFFCVSGYLIVQSLLLKADLLVFARNRIVRIYPVFLTLQLIVFLLGPHYAYAWMGRLRGHPLDWLAAFVSNLLFLPGIFPLAIAQKNAWSLSYEALFYVAAALLFFAIHRRQRALTVLFVAGCAALIVWRPLAVFFVVGYLAFLVEKRYPARPRWTGWLALPSLFVGVWLFPLHPFAAIVPVFIVFYAVTQGIGPMARWLSWKPLLFLGRISFSLYLVHPFAIDPIRSLLLRFGHRDLCTLFFPVAGMAAALVSSTISHNLIERRLTRLILHRNENDRLQRA